jgi:hypothetical protein
LCDSGDAIADALRFKKIGDRPPINPILRAHGQVVLWFLRCYDRWDQRTIRRLTMPESGL